MLSVRGAHILSLQFLIVEGRTRNGTKWSFEKDGQKTLRVKTPNWKRPALWWVMGIL